MRAILTYHSIDTSGSPISCHPDAFERHLKWLTSGLVRVTTVEELVALPSTADAVAITFDDGFVNFAEIAAPRLLGHGFPVTVFVVTDRVGSSNAWDARPGAIVPHLPLLDWPALVRLQEQGVTLGAHSRTHRDLTRLGARDLEDEVQGARARIEDRTGCRPTLFAYPYGRTNAESARIVERTFRYGCTTEFHALDGTLRPALLPRLDMFYFQREHRLDRWGTTSFEAFLRLRHGLRRARQVAARVRYRA
jgi:peptidoglycan/xylan/chitin deacetylase (PgdA/CDA1 family)